MKFFFIHLLICIFSLNAWSNKEILGQFDSLMHENKGCPINSHCSKASGQLLLEWQKLIDSLDEKTKVTKLNEFKNKMGTPIQFLVEKSESKHSDIILWNSRCRKHNPINPNNDILKGMAFLKEIKNDKNHQFPPIRIYDGSAIYNYFIPYQDQVYFIKNNELVILKDYEDFYYQIAVTKEGTYKFVSFPNSLITMALDKKVNDIKCPKEMEINQTFFVKTYCQKILDLDSNDLKIIQYAWTCP